MEDISELYKLVYQCKLRNKNSIEILCNKFSPLIKKYSYMLKYEDAYNDLIIVLLNSIYKMPLNNFKFKKDYKYILSYLNNSIKNAYISLNKKYKNYNYYEINTEEFNSTIENRQLDNSFFNHKNDNLLIIDLKNLLNKNEFNLFTMKFIKIYFETRC